MAEYVASELRRAGRRACPCLPLSSLTVCFRFARIVAGDVFAIGIVVVHVVHAVVALDLAE